MLSGPKGDKLGGLHEESYPSFEIAPKRVEDKWPTRCFVSDPVRNRSVVEHGDR